MNLLRQFAMWLVWDGPINLGPLAPWVFGFAMGRMPHRVEVTDD